MTNRVALITSSSIFMVKQGLFVLAVVATISATGAKTIFLIARIPTNGIAKLQGTVRSL